VQVSKAGADMKMPSAWNITQGDTSIIVAILDTGCKWKSPEFFGRIWTNPKEIAGNGLDDDNNGLIDDIHGWNFTDNNADIDDPVSHGTFVACIIGANANNGIGTAGVDWRCKLMIIRADLIGKSFDSSSQSKGIRYAVDMGAKVVNMSFGLSRELSEVNSAINYGLAKGVVFLSSSGNEDKEFINYPASFSGVIAVGSTDPDDRLSHYSRLKGTGSNYGNRLDVVAPGNWIVGLDI